MARRDDLRKLSRGALIDRARDLGVTRPATLTQSELIQEIEARLQPPSSRAPRSWLERARDLIADVIDHGLNLPEAAKLVRGPSGGAPLPVPPPPLPTVTLAEIYAGQGYHSKAVSVLDEVLASQPDHADARSLRQQYAARLEAASSVASPAEESDAEEPDAEEPDAEPAPEAVPATLPATPSTPAVDAGSAPGAASAAEVPSDASPPQAVEARAEPPASNEPSAPADAAAPALPDRYDVDEVVALATDPHTAYVYWEVTPLRLARLRWRDPAGHLVVRVLSAGPTASEGTRTWDEPVDELVGDLFLRGLSPGAELRLSLGWLGANGYLPVAVAPSMTMPADHASALVASAEGPWRGAGGLGPDAAADPAVAHASGRFVGYLAHGGSPPRIVRAPGDGAAWVAGPSGAVFGAGGSSELYARPLPHAGGRGGASDLYGGASDLYGGASDLYGGASDLSRAGPALRDPAGRH